MKEKLMAFRLPAEIDKEIEKISYSEDTDKSKLIRELIVLGIKAKKLEEAIRAYSEGEVSLWKASKMAEISLWKIMEIVRERKIEVHYGERELKEDLKALLIK